MREATRTLLIEFGASVTDLFHNLDLNLYINIINDTVHLGHRASLKDHKVKISCRNVRKIIFSINDASQMCVMEHQYLLHCNDCNCLQYGVSFRIAYYTLCIDSFQKHFYFWISFKWPKNNTHPFVRKGVVGSDRN